MKKLLMTAALLAVGATAFANNGQGGPAKVPVTASAPVTVSLDVVETSQLVIMDNGTQLTQIDLKHPQILLASAKNTNTPSVVIQNFKVQTGDGSDIKISSANPTTIEYKLDGVATGNALTLVSPSGTLASTLKLSLDSEAITGGAAIKEGQQNAITSTIAPNALNGLQAAGTYTASATLRVTAK